MQTHTNSPQRVISSTIWTLSLVSLLTDTASEMLYPVMPAFLQQVGFSVVLIGLLEGVAEAVTGLTRSYFGKWSDTSGKRVPFVQMGYALSAISKPLMVLFIYPLWIFLCRTIDRFGKGVRTGARDAMLSDASTQKTRGRVFGFHRGMDTLGAVLGPCIALIYLQQHPNDYSTLFLIAFIPGLLAVVSTAILKDRKIVLPPEVKPSAAHLERIPTNGPGNPLFTFAHYWKKSPAGYKRLVTGLLLFALVNSADIFLLLKARESGLTDTAVIGIYIFYNLVYAIAAYPIGMLADKIGLKKILISGFVLFSFVYAGFAFNNNHKIFYLLFALYALYAAATESIAKAWITNLVDTNQTATAIGTFSGLQSIAALAASSMAGLLWYHFGAQTTFLVTAGVSMLVVFYLWKLGPTDKAPGDPGL